MSVEDEDDVTDERFRIDPRQTVGQRAEYVLDLAAHLEKQITF